MEDRAVSVIGKTGGRGKKGTGPPPYGELPGDGLTTGLHSDNERKLYSGGHIHKNTFGGGAQF